MHLEDVLDWLRSWRLRPLFVGIVVHPTEPGAALADVLDHDEVVAVGIGPLDPVLEARILELEDVVDLDLVHPLLVVDHDLAYVGLEE